jgi:hypothetical protein
MTAATDTSRHESVGGRDGDSVRSTPVRNPINVESLSSWIVNNSPLLQSIIFGSADGRSNNDGQWLQKRMQVKQFGKLAVLHLSNCFVDYSDIWGSLDAQKCIRLWAVQSNILIDHI